MNPYENPRPIDQQTAERTLFIDPVTGEQSLIGARIERTRIDPATGDRIQETTHIVVKTPEGAALLFPFNQPLFACGTCGAKPLLRANQCMRCGRHLCDADTIILGEEIICITCAPPLWKRFLTWLTQII